MNKPLMEEIAKHILAGIGVLPANHIDNNQIKSLMSKDFLLDNKIVFKADDGNYIKNSVYGCQINIEQKDFRILLGDCTQDKNIPEFCLLIQLDSSPAYGLYLVCDPSIDSEVLIAATVNNQHWIPCSTFLQATFLVAMERLKDLGLVWSKCTNYKQHYELMVSLITFHTAYQEQYEG
jgi:hypothetical protein